MKFFKLFNQNIILKLQASINVIQICLNLYEYPMI